MAKKKVKKKPKKMKKTHTSVARASTDLLRENKARLKELFPEVVTEQKIDFVKLREALGDDVDDRAERYSFTWAGKRDAIRVLQTPSRATLVPAPKESVNFDTTNNIFIEGENLEVLKLLYKSYAGRVKMIYIDPPYNTGNDYIYPDNFADPLDTYLKLTGQKDAEGNLLTSNPETAGRYHSAWLTMMYPRLFVARQLLAEDGVIFVSIDDHELANLRLLMNEVFGEENFLSCIAWKKRSSPDARSTIGSVHDYILCYLKNGEQPKLGVGKIPLSQQRRAAYANPDNDPRGLWASVDMTGMTGRATKDQFFKVTSPSGRVIGPPEGRSWGLAEATFDQLRADNRIWFGPSGDNVPRIKVFLSESKGQVVPSFWDMGEVGSNDEASKEIADLFAAPKVFDTPKPYRLIKRMLQIATTEGNNDIVLDFFGGSASTAHAVLQMNEEEASDRRFVIVQLPEACSEESEAAKAGFGTIADLGKERTRRVLKRLEAERKEKAKAAKKKLPGMAQKTPTLDLGFKVFKLTESNYRPWKGLEEKDGKQYADEMSLYTDPLVPGWEPINVIYEVALKEGYILTCRIDRVKDAKGNKVYLVTDPDRDQSFRICLDNKLKGATVKALGLKKENLFICRDVAITDEQAANLALQCNLKTI